MVAIWYLVGAGLWAFAAGISYAFHRDRGSARAFFAFPIWPATLVWVAVLGGIKLWKSAQWPTP